MKTYPIVDNSAMIATAMEAGELCKHLDDVLPYYTRAMVVDGVTVIVRKTPINKRAFIGTMGLESGGILPGRFDTKPEDAPPLTKTHDSAVIWPLNVIKNHEDVKVKRLFIDPPEIISPQDEPLSYIYRVKDRKTKDVPADVVNGEVDEYYKRLEILTKFPASLWSGKMRRCLQGKYGSKVWFDLWKETGPDGYTDILKWRVRNKKENAGKTLAEDTAAVGMQITGGFGLVGPFNGRYFGVTLTGGNIMACEIDVPYKGYFKDSKNIDPGLEVAVLQSARPRTDKDGVLWRQIGKFEVDADPIYYDWKFNDRGDEAAVVTVKFVPWNEMMSHFESTLYKASFRCGDKDTDFLQAMVHVEDSGKFLTPGGVSPCWIPAPDIGMAFIWLPTNNHYGIVQSATSPIYCVYDGNTLRVVKYATSMDTTPMALSGPARDAAMWSFFWPFQTTPGNTESVSAKYKEPTGYQFTQGYFVDGNPPSYNTEHYIEERKVEVSGKYTSDAPADGSMPVSGVALEKPGAPCKYYGREGTSGAVTPTWHVWVQRATLNYTRTHGYTTTIVRSYCLVPYDDCNVVYTGTYVADRGALEASISDHPYVHLDVHVKEDPPGGGTGDFYTKYAWSLADPLANILT